MKTVITESVNEFNIVIGFGVPAIDPKASHAVLDSILLESSEMQAVTAKKTEIETRMLLAAGSKKAAQIAQTQEDRDVKNAEYRLHVSKAETLVKDELIPLNDAFEAHKRSLWDSENVVHFTPKQGEFIKTDAEVAVLKSAYSTKGIGKSLLLDATIIDDLRGTKYWTSTDGVWDTGTITDAGVVLPVGAIKEIHLTDIQKTEIVIYLEVKRVEGLTLAEKDSERLAAIDAVTAQSVALRSQYEIESRVDPLGDAQAWLAAEIVKIEAKYV